MSELEPIAERILDLVAGHAPSAESVVTVSRIRHGLTRFANSYIHQHVGEDRTAVSLKVAVDGRVLSNDTSNLASDDDLDRFVSDSVTAARLLPVDTHWPGVAPAAPAPDVAGADGSTWEAEPAERAELVRTFIDQERGSMRAAGFVDTSADETVVATSAGQRLHGRSTRATLDGIQQTDTSAGYGHQTSRRFDELDAAAAGARAADLAERSAATVDVDPGEYEVVLSPECVAEMLSFLAFYGFNAKEHIEGQSFVRLGEQQFDASVSLLDDATDPRAITSGFDADGTPKRPIALIRDGVTTNLAHDRRTAARAGTESTGHAIPGGDAWGAFPTNLFLAPGDRSPEELVAGVDRGLLVTTFNYVRILDPKSQVATGLTRNGTFLIERGEVTRPVSNLRFTQSFVAAFAPGNVVALGSDARFAACEFGEGIVHCPSARLGAFTFTGGAAG